MVEDGVQYLSIIGKLAISGLVDCNVRANAKGVGPTLDEVTHPPYSAS